MSQFSHFQQETGRLLSSIEKRASDKIGKGLKAATDSAFTALSHDSSEEAVERAFLIRAEYVRYINGEDFLAFSEAVRNRH